MTKGVYMNTEPPRMTAQKHKYQQCSRANGTAEMELEAVVFSGRPECTSSARMAPNGCPATWVGFVPNTEFMYEQRAHRPNFHVRESVSSPSIQPGPSSIWVLVDGGEGTVQDVNHGHILYCHSASVLKRPDRAARRPLSAALRG